MKIPSFILECQVYAESRRGPSCLQHNALMNTTELAGWSIPMETRSGKNRAGMARAMSGAKAVNVEFHLFHLRNAKRKGPLIVWGFCGILTTQFCGDHFINHEISIPIFSQPV